MDPIGPRKRAPEPWVYHMADPVWVYSFGRWYHGFVTAIGRTRVRATYTTGTGATRDTWFTRDLIQPRLKSDAGSGL